MSLWASNILFVILLVSAIISPIANFSDFNTFDTIPSTLSPIFELTEDFLNTSPFTSSLGLG